MAPRPRAGEASRHGIGRRRGGFLQGLRRRRGGDDFSGRGGEPGRGGLGDPFRAPLREHGQSHQDRQEKSGGARDREASVTRERPSRAEPARFDLPPDSAA